MLVQIHNSELRPFARFATRRSATWCARQSTILILKADRSKDVAELTRLFGTRKSNSSRQRNTASLLNPSDLHTSNPERSGLLEISLLAAPPNGLFPTHCQWLQSCTRCWVMRKEPHEDSGARCSGRATVMTEIADTNLAVCVTSKKKRRVW